jgi:hypothetical protein
MPSNMIQAIYPPELWLGGARFESRSGRSLLHSARVSATQPGLLSEETGVNSRQGTDLVLTINTSIPTSRPPSGTVRGDKADGA